MLFKEFKVVNPWTKAETETGNIISINPENLDELRGLAKKCGVMYVAASGEDDANPDYLYGFNVYFDDEDFEESQTFYIFRSAGFEDVVVSITNAGLSVEWSGEDYAVSDDNKTDYFVRSYLDYDGSMFLQEVQEAFPERFDKEVW